MSRRPAIGRRAYLAGKERPRRMRQIELVSNFAARVLRRRPRRSARNTANGARLVSRSAGRFGAGIRYGAAP